MFGFVRNKYRFHFHEKLTVFTRLTPHEYKKKKNNNVAYVEKETIAIINGGDFTPEQFDALKRLEAEKQAKVRYVINTDMHHMFSGKWTEKFPSCEILFIGRRGPKMWEGKELRFQVLDDKNPIIPGLDESEIKMVPLLGFHYPGDPMKFAGRNEAMVYFPKQKLAYCFDIFVPQTLGVTLNVISFGLLNPSFVKLNDRGLSVIDKVAAAASSKVIRECLLNVDELVMSHIPENAKSKKRIEELAALLKAWGAV